jgi:hypothetical protein
MYSFHPLVYYSTPTILNLRQSNFLFPKNGLICFAGKTEGHKFNQIRKFLQTTCAVYNQQQNYYYKKRNKIRFVLHFFWKDFFGSSSVENIWSYVNNGKLYSRTEIVNQCMHGRPWEMHASYIPRILNWSPMKMVLNLPAIAGSHGCSFEDKNIKQSLKDT